jgi:hypothetical protein
LSLIRISLAAAAAAAIATPALADQAGDTFNAFRAVCGDTHADYTAAIAAAGKTGWQASQFAGAVMGGVTVIDKADRGKAIGDASLVLTMMHGTAVKDPTVNVYTCTLQTDRGGYPALKSAVQGWLGFDPASTTDSVTTYRFTEENGKFRAAAASEFDSAAAAGGMEILTVKRDGNTAILDYVKIKK